ncbi:hypothetical protein IH824_04235 [candidate division KSB1 bacterium]|nr:hypothetical protein [candidate division KSB1 bacterium]
MFKKFDLKPQDKSKITLFANKAEAIVFWLSLAGLIFLGIISLSRFLTNKQSELETDFRRDLVIRIETLEEQNRVMKSQSDSLKQQLQNLKNQLDPGSVN